ncbi:thermonuclease family protein [Bradyrhizobium ontarionense]|uniref:Thermonuclease family protein n=1 Tax=Bradyrhizobium ontarionense TaxID=2898149 RepID=A0ABY3RMG1_9BRAD|nr:thermonuclease family protein [Bradyrhizobium sp. A19]UFZ08479.1 thermonuclease family protein [Bradyrhizobium sp. A19]
MFAEQGDGHVSAIIDARSFRLSDGREIRLAGIEAPPPEQRAASIDALGAILRDRDVVLRGNDDAPDRYGRQRAFAWVAGSDRTVQGELLAQGAALQGLDVQDGDCALNLRVSETEARTSRRGIWAAGSVIKNAESPDDILAAAGLFTVVEGKVLSVRQTSTTTYLNFARSWTRGFAVTIPKRMMVVFEGAGIDIKSLANRPVRVRGWIEAHTGPRMELTQPAQIEILSSN